MRKVLVLLALAWVAVTIAAAGVAVDHEVPHDLSFLGDPGDPDRVGEDWLFDWGTGLAPPLAAAAAGVVLAVTSSLDGTVGRLAAFLLGLLGGLSVIYTLANEVTGDLLVGDGGEPVESALVAATLALATLLTLAGFATWLTAPRERYP